MRTMSLRAVQVASPYEGLTLELSDDETVVGVAADLSHLGGYLAWITREVREGK